MTGCNPGDPITIHESVPVTRSIDGNSLSTSDEPRFRMIAAINEQPDGTWFFKLTGSLEQVAGQESLWEEFLSSVRFVAGQPEWELPGDWIRQPERPMRFATLKTGPDEEAAEISISSLPPGQPLLANVNRWRGQLGLSPIDQAQLLLQIQRADGDDTEFQVYDARGPRLDTGMGAPFAGGGMGGGESMPNMPGAVDPSESVSPATPAKPASLDFQEPPDWAAGKSSSFVAGRWSRDTAEGALEMSLLKMNPSDESWQMNVRAWAHQIGLADELDVQQLTQTITVDATEGRTLRLDGPGLAENAPESPAAETPAAEPAERSVIVAMFEDRAGNGWVVKFSGPPQAVDQHQKTFDLFIESIRFR